MPGDGFTRCHAEAGDWRAFGEASDVSEHAAAVWLVFLAYLAGPAEVQITEMAVEAFKYGAIGFALTALPNLTIFILTLFG